MSTYKYDSAYAQGEIDAYVTAIDTLKTLAPVQPEPSEITDEQAILHLQSTGWMQNHDREIYESGLKERLADDSESYDSLIPYEDDVDTISRQAAVDVVDFECGEWRGLAKTIINKLEALPAVQPERVCVATVTLTDEQAKEAVEKAKNAVISVIESEPHWISCSERLPNHDEYIKNNGLFIVSDGNRSYSEWYDIYDKRKFGEPTMSGFRIDYAVTAWMPMPIPPYCGV